MMVCDPVTPGDRLPCCIPHCGRTVAKAVAEEKRWGDWICGVHWKSVRPNYRRVHGRILRRGRNGLAVSRERADRIWARVKRAAVERAAGLS
jgi:hypothetical protein